jgi:hypothetical protein
VAAQVPFHFDQIKAIEVVDNPINNSSKTIWFTITIFLGGRRQADMLLSCNEHNSCMDKFTILYVVPDLIN